MTIDDLYEVFVTALYDPVTGKRTKDPRDGLRAVLETHVKPLLSDAFSRGAVFGRSSQVGIIEAAERDAAPIIAQLTGRTDG